MTPQLLETTLPVLDTTHPDHICKECEKKAGIEYKNNDGFFTPRLRSINHLEVGYSKIISNPFTIFLELLYVGFKQLRKTWQNFCKWLFPRTPTIKKQRIDSTLVGSLMFAEKADKNTPIHNMQLEFWARTWLGTWRKLSEGYSNHQGEFALPFHLRAARNVCNRVLYCEIHGIDHIRYDGDTPRLIPTVFKRLTIPKKDLIGMRYNLRTIHLEYWEYRTDFSTPRARIEDSDTNSPEYYSKGRSDAMIEQVIPIELTKLKHLEQIQFAPETISIEQIQAEYPRNLTRCIEEKLPGYSRGDDWFGKRMMNGMNKGAFLKDRENPEYYWIKYFGVCNYHHNDKYALPTAEIQFKFKDNGLPEPLTIVLTGQLNAFEKDPFQKHTFTPKDGEHWLAAKRIARVSGATSTEVDEHFTGTHLNAEQFALAAYRNLRRNPVAYLLLPHLKEVSLINHTADKLLLNGYLQSATAFTYKGIEHRTRDILGVQDWWGWKPMEVLSDAHTYAKAEQLFWEVTGQFVDTFFDQYEAEIKHHWHEIWCFSEDLVRNSVPVFLSDVDIDALPLHERKLAKERLEYYTFQYSFQLGAPRVEYNGEKKVITPITQNPRFDDASNDMQNLKDACRYAIMVATFMHTWINEHQYDDIGEILYNCLGLRFGTGKSGVLAPENDMSIAPDLTSGTQMMWFANLLSRTEYGFITNNEEGDVHPAFISLLEERRAQFLELGVDIDAIESRTNI